jgi:CelD/BcsL family acetyltransferase involved in cellulose biosynthesis
LEDDGVASAFPSGVAVRVIREVEELEGLEPQWDALARRAHATPFLLCAYIAESWRAAGADGYCLVAERAGRLVGALPLQARRRLWAREGVPLAGQHRCDILCDPGETHDTARALLLAARELPIDWVPVYGVMSGSVLARALSDKALHPQQEQVWHLDMSDGWEAAYTGVTSSKRRASDRKQLRRLASQGEVRFDVATEPDDVQPALTAAFEIYGRRWSDQAGEAGGFASNEQAWRSVAARLAARGNVQLVILRLDGAPIAFTYNFTFNETLWGHRLGHVRAYDQFSPGRLAMLHTFEAAAAAGAKRVDFGIGGNEYKAKLSTGSTALLWGTAVTSGMRGVTAARFDEARFAARQRAKQSSAALRVREQAFALKRRWAARNAGSGRRAGDPQGGNAPG